MALPSRSGSQWQALCMPCAFYTELPPPPTGFPPPLGAFARPALSSPLEEPSILALPHKHFANFQAHLAPSAPGMGPPNSSLVTDIK